MVRRPAAVVAAASALVFVVDSWFVAVRASAGWDRRAELSIHGHLSQNLRPLMLGLSVIGNTGEVLALAVAAALVLLWRRRYRESLLLALAPAVAILLDAALKVLFARPRPHLWRGAALAASYSFPSGHATASAALAAAITCAALWMFGRKGATYIGVMGAVFALGVGLSRIYLGVHWPTDIVGGYAVASLTVAAMALCFREATWRLPARYRSGIRRR